MKEEQVSGWTLAPYFAGVGIAVGSYIGLVGSNIVTGISIMMGSLAFGVIGKIIEVKK